MQTLTRSLTAILGGLFLMAGSCAPEIPPAEEPELAFCDGEEARRFSQEEIDWRGANAPWNLRRDFKTNTTGTRECGWFQEGEA